MLLGLPDPDQMCLWVVKGKKKRFFFFFCILKVTEESSVADPD
jgi:hypothetical protein